MTNDQYPAVTKCIQTRPYAQNMYFNKNILYTPHSKNMLVMHAAVSPIHVFFIAGEIDAI